MTPLTQAFSAALLHFIWEGLLVAAALWIALYLLRNSTPNVRYATCCAALGLLVAMPAITISLLYQPAHPASFASTASIPASPAVGTILPGTPTTQWLAWAQLWALPLWSLGVLFFSARIAWGCTQVARLRRRGEPASPDVLAIVEALSTRVGLTQPIRIIISSLSNGPSVVGWLRPVVLLPASVISGLSTLQLEAILAHELAHIRRNDYLVNLLQMAVEALLFYHPAVWWVSEQIRSEREFCCDDLAVRTCQDALGYARALTLLEKLRLLTPTTAMGSTSGPLRQRIERIVGAPAHSDGPSPLSAILALALGLGGIALNVGLVRGQAPADEGSVTVTARGLKILSQTPIEYPASAKAARLQGNVAVSVTIDGAGYVTDARPIRIIRPAPSELQETVLTAVRRWRFTEDDPSDMQESARYVFVAYVLPPPVGSAERYLKDGDALYKAGKVEEAFRWYENGEQKYPERKLDFLKRETEVYIRQGNQTAVKAKINEIFKESPGDPETRGLRASITLDEGGDNSYAISELTEVISAKPDNFVAHFNLGRAYFASDRYDAAEAQFDAALKCRPDYAPARAGLTQLELKKKDYDGALLETDELLRMHPENTSGKILKSAALAGLKRYDEARALVLEVLASDPKNAEALAQQKSLDELR